MQNGNEISVKMDILWVIDNSGSMAPYQAELKAKFSNFMEVFAGKGYDFRMAVISTDAWSIDSKDNTFNHATQTGAAVDTHFSSVLGSTVNTCPDSSNVSSLFLDGNPNSGEPRSGVPLISSADTGYDILSTFQTNVGIGDAGCGAEGGLESIKAAFANPGNASYDFPRNDAHLAIILVSDEEDYSYSGLMKSSDLSVAAYDAYLKSISSTNYGYSFHSIALFADNFTNSGGTKTCLDEAGNTVSLHPVAAVGQRYSDLSDLSGGIKASICHDFSGTLQNIAQTIVEKTVEFKLTDTPANPNKLVVSIRNPGESQWTTVPQNANNGWTYSAENNSIVFHGSGIPAQGAAINIYYDPDGL